MSTSSPDKLEELTTNLYIACGALGFVSFVLVIAVCTLITYVRSVSKSVKDLKVYTESFVSGNNFKGIPRLDPVKDKQPGDDFQQPRGGHPGLNEPPQPGFNARPPPQNLNMGRNPIGRRDDDMGAPSWQADQNQMSQSPKPGPSQNFTFGRPLGLNNYDRGAGQQNFDRPPGQSGFDRNMGQNTYDNRPMGNPRMGSNIPGPQPHRPGRGVGY